MDKVRLRFWSALGHFCTFMLVFSGVLAFLEYTGKTPDVLRNLLVSASSLEYVRFLPPHLTETWIPLSVLTFAFGAVALAASRQKQIWRPSGFITLPAPNGGYLRKAVSRQFRKELKGGSWKTRREAKAHYKKAEKHFEKNQYRSAAAEYQKSASVFMTMFRPLWKETITALRLRFTATYASRTERWET
jgi:hypothetical protein